MITTVIMRPLKALLLSIVLCATAFAQTPVPAPRTPEAPDPKPAPPVQVESSPNIPQVVTIVHRLNGVKVIRWLLRGNEQQGAIESLDEAFQMAGGVHTNVIAGLALSDGQTIAAWLPEAGAELPPLMPAPPAAPARPTTTVAPESPTPKAAAAPFVFQPATARRTFNAVDVKIVTRDGRNLLGRYVGLDGLTGLSVISLRDANLVKSIDAPEQSIEIGQVVRLIGPEPVAQPAPGSKPGIYVRVGETEATVVDVTRTARKTLARVKIKSAKLSAANIGAVAVNEAGEPLGIVNAVEGDEATVLPVGLVRSAARRVVERQASVPRPWLGVRGEPIDKLTWERITKNGWQAESARALAEKRQGIMLTSVVAGSPASMALLKAGDVILSVNDQLIQNAEDFSQLLQNSAPGTFVNFTVARPGNPGFEDFKIKLAEAPDPFFGFTLFDVRTPAPMAPRFLLPGIQTIAIRPRVAARLGATGGMLISYVEPNGPSYVAGLRAGDVIESINNDASVNHSASGAVTKTVKTTVVVVRDKKKLTIVIPDANK